MSRTLMFSMLLCFAAPMLGWQKPAGKPSFTGVWQLDAAKSKTELKGLVWKIDQKDALFAIEEIESGKPVSASKCPIGKACEFEDSGKKMSAMTYFLDSMLIQTRSAADNSAVVKRKLKLNDDGSLLVELVTIVPSDKTETLVFTRQNGGATATAAAQ
jgi:hypothetical protein